MAGNKIDKSGDEAKPNSKFAGCKQKHWVSNGTFIH